MMPQELSACRNITNLCAPLQNENYVLSYLWANDQSVQNALQIRNVSCSEDHKFEFEECLSFCFWKWTWGANSMWWAGDDPRLDEMQQELGLRRRSQLHGPLPLRAYRSWLPSSGLQVFSSPSLDTTLSIFKGKLFWLKFLWQHTLQWRSRHVDPVRGHGEMDQFA